MHCNEKTYEKRNYTDLQIHKKFKMQETSNTRNVKGGKKPLNFRHNVFK